MPVRLKFDLKDQIRVLEVLCYWLNFSDAVGTAYHLTLGDYELNFLMRRLWVTSPLLYATGKFFLFRAGMAALEAQADNLTTRRNILLGVVSAYLCVVLWHAVIYLV